MAGDLLDQVDDRPAQIGVLDLRIGAQQAEGAGDGEQLQRRRLIGGLALLACQQLLAGEERTDRHAEHFGNLGQASGADPVDALLVFLDLLEGHAQLIRQRGLRQATRQSFYSDPMSHFDIHRIRPFH
jgi:hypothetical protein